MNKSKKFSFNNPKTRLFIQEQISEEEITERVENADKNIETITKLSEEKTSKLEEIINKEAIKEQNDYYIQINEVAEAIQKILYEQDQIPTPFFKGLDSTQEFGISRFVADKMYHLPTLLGSTILEQIKDGIYLVSAEHKDSSNNSIKLEHRFKATNNEEAEKLYERISSQLAGIQLKIWISCWKLANGKEALLYSFFSCFLTELMNITYQERNGNFTTDEKIDFYEHLKSLEQTKFVLSKPQRKKKKTDETIYRKIEISLLEIGARDEGEYDKYPQQLTICLLKFPPNPEKIVFVGAAFKNDN